MNTNKFHKSNLFNDIIKNNNSRENIKKWKNNGKIFSKEYIVYIRKSNFIIDCILTILSICAICLLNMLKHNYLSDILLSLSCSIIAGVIVAFFYERVSNKNNIENRISYYNFLISKVYNSLQSITNHALESIIIMECYSTSGYLKEKGLKSTDNLNYDQLYTEVEAKYKEILNEQFWATAHANSDILNYKLKLTELMNNNQLFLDNFGSLIDKKTLSEFQDIQFWSHTYLQYVDGFVNKILKTNITTLDHINLWARKKVNDNFVLNTYAKL